MVSHGGVPEAGTHQVHWSQQLLLQEAREDTKLRRHPSIGESSRGSSLPDFRLSNAYKSPNETFRWRDLPAQVEMNPVWQQKKLMEFCKANGIVITAFSPLGARGTNWGTNLVVENESLREIAEARGKTLAQVHVQNQLIDQQLPIQPSLLINWLGFTGSTSGCPSCGIITTLFPRSKTYWSRA